jgi:mevalonate kinase
LERGFSPFSSKLLLFGEYGLMFDAMALSVPFPRFSGRLGFDRTGLEWMSTAEIRKLHDHLKTGDSFQQLRYSFDLDRLGEDLAKNLFFDSNIPQKYGVGSSGALVAALFSRYGAFGVPRETLNPEVLKFDFALLETFFHGRSSGVDPLISFLNQPMLIDSKKKVRKIDFSLQQTGLAIALIDTRLVGATGPLVQHFIDRFNVPEFEREFENHFIPANNGCIENLLERRTDEFFVSLEWLIRFQLKYFRRMIPEDFYPLVEDALKEQVFIKLLGSGGGGFLLTFARSSDVLTRWAERRSIELLNVV